MSKIKIITPIYRYMEPETERSIANMINTSNNQIVWSKLVGESLISRLRNQVGADFLNSAFDYLMFIDADITWLNDPNFSNNPLDQLQSHNCDIVGGIYVVKGNNCHPSLREIEHQRLFEERKTSGKWIFNIPNNLFEVYYISMGFTLISKRCLSVIYKNCLYPFAPMEGANREYLSEDWAFCHRAKEMGFKIFADPTIELGHIGNYVFTLKDYERKKERS